jgi:hypothetical protein
LASFGSAFFFFFFYLCAKHTWPIRLNRTMTDAN